MKIAAVQMDAVFADVDRNLQQAEDYISRAARQGISMIVLPEFFSSAIGFSEKMLDVPLQGSKVNRFMGELSRKHDIIIGGSYLTFDGHHSYNQFDLVFPDGLTYSHRKDLPTQFENCYYTGGDEANVLHTPIGDIGVALCWELIRYDTLRRLSGQVDFVLAGSCWWDLPVDSKPERKPLRQYNQTLALETPAVFAQLLHAPVVHANHCGMVTAYNFPSADRIQTRQLVGGAQIICANGAVACRRGFSEGEGMVIADLPPTSLRSPASVPDERYWVPSLPSEYIAAWETLNASGAEYYRNIALPHYRKKSL